MDKKILSILGIVVLIILVIIMVINIRNNKQNELRIEEENQVRKVVSEIVREKIMTFTSGYDAEDIQKRMDKEAGENSTTVYREADEVYIKYNKTKNIYRVNDYAKMEPKS